MPLKRGLQRRLSSTFLVGVDMQVKHCLKGLSMLSKMTTHFMKKCAKKKSALLSIPEIDCLCKSATECCTHTCTMLLIPDSSFYPFVNFSLMTDSFSRPGFGN